MAVAASNAVARPKTAASRDGKHYKTMGKQKARNIPTVKQSFVGSLNAEGGIKSRPLSSLYHQ
jgi:hypothetical protein